MDSLEIRHFAPYLPFKLRCKRSGTGASRNKIVSFREVSWFFDNSAKDYELTPILRPMTDLIKEIEIDDQKFIPIIKLWELRSLKVSGEIEKIYIEKDTATIQFKEVVPEPYSYYYDCFEVDLEAEDISFSYVRAGEKYAVSYEEWYLLGGEFKMYQKLFEWNFDVFGLIEKGLAIDMNDFNK